MHTPGGITYEINSCFPEFLAKNPGTSGFVLWLHIRNNLAIKCEAAFKHTV